MHVLGGSCCLIVPLFGFVYRAHKSNHFRRSPAIRQTHMGIQSPVAEKVRDTTKGTAAVSIPNELDAAAIFAVFLSCLFCGMSGLVVHAWFHAGLKPARFSVRLFGGGFQPASSALPAWAGFRLGSGRDLFDQLSLQLLICLAEFNFWFSQGVNGILALNF